MFSCLSNSPPIRLQSLRWQTEHPMIPCLPRSTSCSRPTNRLRVAGDRQDRQRLRRCFSFPVHATPDGDHPDWNSRTHTSLTGRRAGRGRSRAPQTRDPRSRAPPQSTCTKAPVSTRSPTSSRSRTGVQQRAHRWPVRSQVARHSSQTASCGRTGERRARAQLPRRSPHRPQRNPASHCHIAASCPGRLTPGCGRSGQPPTCPSRPARSQRSSPRVRRPSRPSRAGRRGRPWPNRGCR